VAILWHKWTLKVKITMLCGLMIALVGFGTAWLNVFNADHIIRPVPSAVTELFEGADFRMILNEELLQGSPNIRLLPDDFRQGNHPNLQLLPSPLLEQEAFPVFLTVEDAFAYVQQQVAAQQRFRVVSITIAITVVLLGIFGVYLLIKKSVAPIESLAAKMETIDEHQLSASIALPNSQDEVWRLTQSFNHMLEKINGSFERQKLFGQNVAHELKTPLAGIRSTIEVLQMDEAPSSEDYREAIDAVKIGTERLIEMVESLLSLNRDVEGLRWQTVDTGAVFQGIFQQLETDIRQKSLQVEVVGECRLMGDPLLLERALFNLAHNAVRYNLMGGSVRVQLSQEEIRIEDSGIGMEEIHLPRIFEPFYCVDKSRSKKLGGHGLGMTIVRNILDKHGIGVQLFSEVGKGTTVVLAVQKSASALEDLPKKWENRRKSF